MNALKESILKDFEKDEIKYHIYKGRLYQKREKSGKNEKNEINDNK